MFRMSVRASCARSRLAVAAVIAVALAALTITPALADVSAQLEYFYYPDGTLVTSDGGMPFADAALYRFYNKQKANGIEWQLMTVDLTPGSRYGIWLTAEDGSFTWWVGSGTANAVGDLNTMGHVFTNSEDARAPIYLVITTADGEPVQAAFFPGV